jgi:hypothetical protein
MYVAVRRYEGVSDPQKVAKVAEEGFVPLISEMPGFVAHYTLDAGDGVIVGISVFEHKAAEEESTFVAGEFVEEHLLPLMPNRPQITAGEVVAYQAK